MFDKGTYNFLWDLHLIVVNHVLTVYFGFAFLSVLFDYYHVCFIKCMANVAYFYCYCCLGYFIEKLEERVFWWVIIIVFFVFDKLVLWWVMRIYVIARRWNCLVKLIFVNLWPCFDSLFCKENANQPPIGWWLMGKMFVKVYWNVWKLYKYPRKMCSNHLPMNGG